MKKNKKSIKTLNKAVKNLTAAEAKAVKGGKAGFIVIEDLVDN